ncbi:hypothetical protein GCM10023160_30780 [Brachybacterium paraconglomeratum]|uniref:hypothetical protein n=1 Tax=Brachybacterium paraconglomeratum TaxID=173362 RepID=UPI0031EA4E74
MPIGCLVFGHRPSFRAEGSTMYWECERGCGEADGAKTYPTPAHAQRYATAFDRRDNERLGERAPLLGMFPLRIWRWLSHRNAPKV